MTECQNLEDDILGIEASSAKLDLAADVSQFSTSLQLCELPFMISMNVL